MIDQRLLNDTLQKINSSLNKRFEKDTELYISKQNEYEIKKNLCNETYGGIFDMARAKGISNEIIVKVIIKNAGIFNISDINYFKEQLNPILRNTNYKVISYIMEDILENNIYMPKTLRNILFHHYINGITSEDRLNYWNSDKYDFYEGEIKTLFNAIIEKNEPEDKSKILKFKTDFIKEAFEKYPSLLGNKKNPFITMKEIFVDDEEKEKLFEYICEEMYDPSINIDGYNNVLLNVYVSYGEQAFDDTLDMIKNRSNSNFKQYIKAIKKILKNEKDKDVLVRMFDKIYRLYNSNYIKNYIKREIEKKVWNTIKLNETLYAERGTEIDRLISGIEQNDDAKYLTFEDVYNDIVDDKNPRNIAYNWLNIKSPDFEKSIMYSFTKLSDEYLWLVEDTYSYLFKHSHGKGDFKELKRFCERIVKPMNEFISTNQSSEFFDILDSLWIENVVKYKLKGAEIEDYIFKNHYDRVKEWE